MGEFSCSICEDSRHVLNAAGQWVRCSCLEDEILNRKFLRAGISFSKDDLTLSPLALGTKFPNVTLDGSVINYAQEVADRFKAGDLLHKIWCFQGSPTGPKDLVVQTILMNAVLGGLRINQCSMEQLISNHFQGGEISLEDEFNRCDIMCLTFGAELQFNVAGAFLQNLVRLNWTSSKHCLLLNTHLSWDGLVYKYEDPTPKLFVRPKDMLRSEERRAVFASLEL